MRKDEKKSKAIFEYAVNEYVATQLIGNGYARSRFSWFCKWKGDCLWRISCNYQTFRGVDEGRVSTTVGVGFRKIEEFLESWKDAHFSADTKMPCSMATDICYLRNPPNPHSVYVKPDTDGDQLGAFLWNDITENGLGFFDRYGSFEQAVSAWEGGRFFNSSPVGAYLLAAAYCVAGDKQKALSAVEEEIDRSRVQAASGPQYIGKSTEAQQELARELDLRFDDMATIELRNLTRFYEYLQQV